jgi:WD40 repeat protein/energy-coupling factor transporter ATP-binding protein EcfA2
VNLLANADIPPVAPILTEDFHPENPYKGLRAFQSADNQDFFGREKVTAKLLKRMEEVHEFGRFLAVIGPSGSGKSSLVKAGLIPALWRGELPGSEKWFIIEMLPGAHPLDELEIALTRVAANQAGNLHEQLTRDRRGLIRAAQLILPGDDSELVVMIDQFEEVFTLLEDETLRGNFLDLLYTAVIEPRSRVRIVITLRADFYDRPLHYADFGELVRSRMETVLPLSAQELERAISKPAERVGVAFEPGLVASIVAEVNYQAGALPLLQYALTELFEQRKGRLLTREAYEAIGGSVGALAQRADEVYRDFDAGAQEAARQMFLRLVTLGEGVEDTRRRVHRSELLAIAPESEVMDEIIDTYAEYRLLSLDNDPGTRAPTVEVAHEAILRIWERLRGWLTESRDEIKSQRLLAAMVADWMKAGQEPSYLLRGARLEQFSAWQDSTSIVLTPVEKQFLQASIATRDEEYAEERKRLEREAALEQRSKRRMRYLVVVLALLALTAVIFSVFALDRETQIQGAYATSQANLSRAEREAEVNHSLVLANAAAYELATGSTELALMLALEAYHIPDPPAAAERALRAVADKSGSRAVLPLLTSQINAVAVSPDSAWGLAAGCADLQNNSCTLGEIVLFAMQATDEIQRLYGHTDTITSAVFTPDGHGLWSASADGSIALWDLNDGGRIVRRFELDLGGVRQIAQSPEGTRLLAATQTGLVLIDPADGRILQAFEGHTGSVNTVAFSPDGAAALSGGADRQVILWDVRTGALVRRMLGHFGPVLSLAFHPDGLRAVSCSVDFSVRIWSLETGEELQRANSVNVVQAVVVQPDGRRLIADFGAALLIKGFDQWSEADYLTIDPTGGGEAGSYDPTALAFDPSGQFVLSGLQNGNLILWTMAVERLTQRYADPAVSSEFLALDLRADGLRLAAGSASTGEALVWDIDPRSPTYATLLARLPGHQGAVFPLRYTPDGTALLVGSGDWFGGTTKNSLNLWNVDESSPTYGTIIRTFEGLTFYPRAFAFTPDNHYLLVGTQNVSREGEFMMWDMLTGAQVKRFQTGPDVSNILLSADGKRALTVSAFFSDITEWDIDPLSPAFGEVLRVIPTNSVAYDLEWGPTPATFFLGDLNSTLQERDYQTGQVIRSFTGGGTAGMWSVDLSPDQQQVITGSDNGEIVLWDYGSGREIWRAPRQSAFILSLYFHPDGKSAFAVTFPGIPTQWNVVQPSLIELLNWIETHRYMREFTCIERLHYQIQPLCEGVEGVP